MNSKEKRPVLIFTKKALTAAMLVTSCIAPLQAQQIEEVIVTSQKRAQSLSDVPISISAFSADFLARSNIDTAGDLQAFTPGFTGYEVSSGQPAYSIRGVQSNDFNVGSEPSIGVYLDEIYIARNGGAVIDLYDIDRIEVLKGPQGSLFGRNTTAGAISIHRKTPANESSGELSVGVGNFGYQEYKGYVNLPIIENKFLARANIRHRSSDGFIDFVSPPTGNGLAAEATAYHGALRFIGSERADIVLNIDYHDENSDSGVYQSLLNPFNDPVSDFYESGSDLGVSNRNRRDSRHIYLKVDFDLSATLSVKSITSFREYNNDYLEDTDGTSRTLLHFGIDEENETFQQELRLTGASFDSRLSWFAGVTYAQEDVLQESTATYDEESICGAQAFLLGFPPLPCDIVLASLVGPPFPFGFLGAEVTEQTRGNGSNESVSLFFDGTYDVTDHLRVTAGLQYVRDEKELDLFAPHVPSTLGFIIAGAGQTPSNLIIPAFEGEFRESFDDLMPRMVIDYNLNADIMLYASATKGYKGGGFNLLVPSAGSFEPEHVWSYETGLKGSAADGSFGFDLSVYYYDYTDLQVLQFEESLTVVRNAAEVDGRGIEISVNSAPMDRLKVIATYAYTDAKFREFSLQDQDLSGNRTQRTPENTASLLIDYQLPGITENLDLSFRAEGSYQTEEFFDPENTGKQGSYGLVNLRFFASALDDRMRVELFVENALDEEYITQFQSILSTGTLITQAGWPRMYGARVAYSW